MAKTARFARSDDRTNSRYPVISTTEGVGFASRCCYNSKPSAPLRSLRPTIALTRTTLWSLAVYALSPAYPGDGEIRTREGFHPARFPSVCTRPLCDVSGVCGIAFCNLGGTLRTKREQACASASLSCITMRLTN